MNVTIVVCIGNVAGHSQLPCNIDEQEIVKWQGEPEAVPVATRPSDFRIPLGNGAQAGKWMCLRRTINKQANYRDTATSLK